MSVEASTSPRRRSQMPQQQLCHLHGGTPSQRPKFPEEQLPLSTFRDTVEGSFDQRFSTLKSIGEDRVNDRELKYNIEMWKATGMALDKVDLVWLSDEIRQHGDEYWPIVMDIARTNSCAGILFQKADIWLLGMEQHDANLLARQYCKHFKKKNKPIAVLDNMLPNLLQYPGMENRRHPAWAIFMEDDKEDICFKMEKAFCPPKLAEGNPCLEYIKYIILPWFGMFEVVQKKGNGGKKTFLSMEELTADYESGALHPADVKLALEKSLNEILQPVRNHFGRSDEAKDLVEAIGECYGAN
uniref:Tyrosine--tRNA ligase n=1 Tax=Oryza punctata TaxID=4537 RepID=A0A0E0LPR6_ORYPU